ncbi:poly [ADP-ribose] polymerase tankyrase isoform X2 [Patella vulgata]|nr:poly [ADP-ribose] polymerase tankyrase isoform X2 [Patella vulgata]
MVYHIIISKRIIKTFKSVQSENKWHQDILLMIQQLKEEKGREIATSKLIIKRLEEEKKETGRENATLKCWLQDIDQRVMKLEAASNPRKQTDCQVSVKIPDVCSHGNGQQQIHPNIIDTVTDLGSTANEEEDTIPKTRPYFLTLHEACLKGDLNNVKGLIDSGHDVNKRYECGMTLILYCSQSQIEPVSKIKLILDKGGNKYDTDNWNDNILHLACGSGLLDTVDYLLKLGFDIHSKGFNGLTPLLHCGASQIEPVSKIKMILDKGGNIDDRDTYNNSVLHRACEYGCLETVKYLLELGLDIQSRCFVGQTPILYSSKSHIEPVSKIKLLLDKGGNIDDTDKHNDNLLFLAYNYGRPETVKFLLDLNVYKWSTRHCFVPIPPSCKTDKAKYRRTF